MAYVEFAGEPETTYTAIGTHKLYAAQSFNEYPCMIEGYCGTYYWDSFNFGYFESQNIESPWQYYFRNLLGSPVSRRMQRINLGTTYDEDSVTTPSSPQIASLTPARGLIGNSINVTIKGKAFRAGSTVQVSGNGVSVSGVNVVSTTQITATLAIALDATAGNRDVTISSRNRNSNSKQFFVQIPRKLVLQQTGQLMTPVNGDVFDASGRLLGSNKCGVYRNYLFALVDQDNPGQRILQSFRIEETFDAYRGNHNRPTADPYDAPPNGLIQDIQLIVYNYPFCPPSDDHESFNIGYIVKIGGVNGQAFDLSTVNHVERGRRADNGQLECDLRAIVP